MLEYTGIIKQVRFYSEDTKFIVCVIDSEQEDKPILATGYMSYVNPQDKYHFQGEYTIHPKYGKQFQIQSYEIILADDESEIIRYLSSPLFKGIGEKQATAIVETLGKDALNRMKKSVKQLLMFYPLRILIKRFYHFLWDMVLVLKI